MDMFKATSSRIVLLCLVLSFLCFEAHCDDSSGVFVKFLKAPHAFSHLNLAKFVFEVYDSTNTTVCRNCNITCQLDGDPVSLCEARNVSYPGLRDGSHKFEVCASVISRGVRCVSYNWTVDTIPPTASIISSMNFTSAQNIYVNISFSEPCMGGGGFGCKSVNACNLLVYGAGQVVPSSLRVLQPNLIYSLRVDLTPTVEFGRAILVMDRNICSDIAGNKFTRSQDSIMLVHIDRRNVEGNLKTHIPQKLLQVNGGIRTVLATNSYTDLTVYIYFSRPVQNTSKQVLDSLKTSQGHLLPIEGKSFANRRFGFRVADISNVSIVTLSLVTNSIISREGSPVTPIAPVTFLYDLQRPAVRLSTKCNNQTKEDSIPVTIKFMKPVFDFNSSHIVISGGHMQSFNEISKSIYTIEVQANGGTVSISVPENVTSDVAGNNNLASNVLHVRHYSVPLMSSVISLAATIAFAVTSFAAGLLTVSTASLQSSGEFFSSSTLLMSDPARNLFRTACYIQIFALSRWLAVTQPVEYKEFTRGLQWSIPYFPLPWENGKTHQLMAGSSPFDSSSKLHGAAILESLEPKTENSGKAAAVYGSPLTTLEYKLYFENQDFKPEAEYLTDTRKVKGWKYFSRSMFWLAVIGGSLILLHALLLLIIKFRKKNTDKWSYGALTFPRFEIFLVILAVPCICEASAAIIRGGTPWGIIIGTLLLGCVLLLLLGLLFFLSIGITFGKLLQYKEVHRVGQKFHCYQELVRVSLGPGKRGQWTWRNQTQSIYLIIFGPLFEDLRGPPKYMLSQISGGHTLKQGDSIIASDDETEDAEAPIIQKLFGILRIYYTLLESVKRVALGIVAGAYSDNQISKTPTITLLCIISFQLFFMVLKKPFIKKKIQLVEIISVASEVGIFATCFVLIRMQFSVEDETKIGTFMIVLFLAGFLPQMVNEWYALYQQTKRLDPAEKSFLSGLKIASIGFLQFFIPQKFMKKLESSFPVNHQGGEDPSSSTSADRQRSSSGSRSSGSTDKPWLRQLRQLAKAGFSKDGNGAPEDPSSSTTRWSGFWGGKRSGSSSVKSSTDLKSKDSKPNRLYKDLEAIFASK